MLMGCFYKHSLHLRLRPSLGVRVCGCIGILYKYIGVGSALLVQLQWAMREASERGMSNMVRLPRFFCIVT